MYFVAYHPQNQTPASFYQLETTPAADGRHYVEKAVFLFGNDDILIPTFVSPGRQSWYATFTDKREALDWLIGKADEQKKRFQDEVARLDRIRLAILIEYPSNVPV